MYRPSANAVADTEALAMVRAHGFGHLVVAGADGLDAVPVPVLVDDDEDENEDDGGGGAGRAVRIRAHVARANALWRAAPCPALLIVSPLDAYVSPSWYATKQRGDPRVVPTWNYELVHVHGTVEARHEAPWKERVVRELTARQESAMAEPWSVDDAPADYIARMLRAIVGLELRVECVEGKRKLSQNRSAADVAGVVAGLAAGPDGARQVAAAMSGLSTAAPLSDA